MSAVFPVYVNFNTCVTHSANVPSLTDFCHKLKSYSFHL